MTSYLSFVIMLLGCCLQAHAQFSDSLYKALPDTLRPKNRNAVSGSEKIRILISVSDATIQNHFTEFTNVAEQLANEIPAQRTNDEKLLYADAIAQFYIQSGNYGKAFEYCQQVVKYGQNTQTNRGKVRDAYINLCTFYSIKQRPDSAITVLHKASTVARAIGDSVSIQHVYTGYKYIYSYLHLFHKALDYAEKEEKTFSVKDRWSDKHTAATMSRGNLYILLYREERKSVYADSARAIFRRVMRVRKADSAVWYSSCYTMLGYIQYLEGQYRQALTLFDSAMLSQYNQPGIFEPRLSTRRNLLRASSLASLGKPEGIKMLKELEISPRDFQSLEIQNKMLYEDALKQGDWKAALNYYRAYQTSADSVDIAGQRGKVFEAEQKYSVVQKEATIAQLENKNLQAQVTRNTILVAVFIGLLLLYIYNKRQQARRLAERQKLSDELHTIEQEMELQRLRQQAETEAAIVGQRKEISQNMHDEVSSSLVALRYHVADMKKATPNESTRHVLDNIEKELNSVYLQTRDLLYRMANTNPQKNYNVFDLLENLSQRFNANSGLQINVQSDTNLQHLLNAQQNAELYRVIKEAVANSMKHSGANRVDISLSRKERTIEFNVWDNGRGLSADGGHGLGMATMKQRLESLNGSLSVKSSATGTSIYGSFPVT